MARARRSKVDDSAARTALLDAAEALMVEEGYAAVTTRRVATRAGLNNGLVYYYFGTMDELFVALFRRSVTHADQIGVAADDPQPLWAMWEAIRDFPRHALIQEFIALANHRAAVHEELTTYWAQSRTAEVAYLRTVLDGYGVDLGAWPPASILLMLVGTSHFLLMEEAFGVHDGHAETVALIERHIGALEGHRRRH